MDKIKLLYAGALALLDFFASPKWLPVLAWILVFQGCSLNEKLTDIKWRSEYITNSLPGLADRLDDIRSGQDDITATLGEIEEHTDRLR